MEKKNIADESKRDGYNFTLSIKRIKRTSSSGSTTDEIKQVTEGSNPPCSPSIRSPLRIIKAAGPRPNSPFLDTFGPDSPYSPLHTIVTEKRSVCSPTIRRKGNSSDFPFQDENKHPKSPTNVFHFDRTTIRSNSQNPDNKENTCSPHRGTYGEKTVQRPKDSHKPNRRNRFSFVSDDCGSPLSPRSPFHYIQHDGHLTPHGIKPHSPCIDRELLEQLEQMSPKPFREEDISSVVTNTYRKCELDDNNEVCETVTESICVTVHSTPLLTLFNNNDISFEWDEDKKNVLGGADGPGFQGWDFVHRVFLALPHTDSEYLYFNTSGGPSKTSADETLKYYQIKCTTFDDIPTAATDDERTIFVKSHNLGNTLVFVFFFTEGTDEYYLYYEEDEDVLYACTSIAKAAGSQLQLK